MNARAPIVWLLTLTLCGCNFAPDYAPPAVKVPAGFKEDKLWTEQGRVMTRPVVRGGVAERQDVE